MNPSPDQNTMEYKGYTATLEWEDDVEQWSGEVQDTWGTVIFQGDTIDDTYQAFRDALDSHLLACEQENEEPRLSNRGLVPQLV